MILLIMEYDFFKDTNFGFVRCSDVDWVRNANDKKAPVVVAFIFAIIWSLGTARNKILSLCQL